MSGSAALAVVFVNFTTFPVFGYTPPCGTGILSNHFCVFTKTAAALGIVAAGLSIPTLVVSIVAASKSIYGPEEDETAAAASASPSASAPGTVVGMGERINI